MASASRAIFRRLSRTNLDQIGRNVPSLANDVARPVFLRALVIVVPLRPAFSRCLDHGVTAGASDHPFEQVDEGRFLARGALDRVLPKLRLNTNESVFIDDGRPDAIDQLSIGTSTASGIEGVREDIDHPLNMERSPLATVPSGTSDPVGAKVTNNRTRGTEFEELAEYLGPDDLGFLLVYIESV
ncbi:MAG TPA: hypothetical protein VN033_09225 [Vulgatibacter sp.]|nr:hypothetical protein [Vulgatibacter sp.]